MELSPIVSPLVSWYESGHRTLPWRDDPTPYHVWISEIMLQQTRIEAVIPYYLRFLSALPTIEALADADDELLLKLWEGLGYYSRVRNLKKAAITVVKEYGGVLPKTAKELRRLSGIGDYTAGAIASIAYGEPSPAVDGNVLRVVARITADTRNVLSPETKRDVTAALQKIYPYGKDAASLTQGLMELGERVCIPNGTPACHACPLADFCEARKKGLTDKIPLREKNKARKTEEKTVFLLHCSATDRYAIRKRENEGLLASLWELPNAPLRLSESDALDTALSLGLSPRAVTPLPDARHLFTHIEWRLSGFSVECEKECEDFFWVTAKELSETYAIASAFRAYRRLIK